MHRRHHKWDDIVNEKVTTWVDRSGGCRRKTLISLKVRTGQMYRRSPIAWLAGTSLQTVTPDDSLAARAATRRVARIE
jgi:hypothetical protein